jgi:hypothetical protein
MTRVLFGIVLSLGVLFEVRTRAITAGQIDADNTYDNVGATLITVRAGHPVFREGTLIGQCTGTLIHPRVELVAGHCVAPGVAYPGIPAWPPLIPWSASVTTTLGTR